MEQEELFAMALGLQKPWYIAKIELITVDNTKQLHLSIKFQRGSKFRVNAEELGVYDTVDRTWRHLNFFQHECYLHASVPRVRTTDGNTLQVDVPWARPGSSFTLLYEAFAMSLCKASVSLKEVGKLMNVEGRVIGRIVKHYVNEAITHQPLEPVKNASVDETSVKRGHNYITVITDVDRKKVVGIGVGKDQEAVSEALGQMEERGANATDIEKVAIDLSPSFTAAVLTQMPNAEIVYDRFHVEQILSKAVDEIRRLEQDEARLLRKTKYIWLRNQSALTSKQKEQIHYLERCFPTLGKAYRLKEQFKEIYNNADAIQAISAMKTWIREATKSGIQPIRRFVNTLKAHWSGILEFFHKRITTAFAERTNLKIQEIKRVARGYRNIDNYITMIMFHCGDLSFTHN